MLQISTIKVNVVTYELPLIEQNAAQLYSFLLCVLILVLLCDLILVVLGGGGGGVKVPSRTV